MRIEVYLNEKKIAEKKVSGAELYSNPYQSFEANVQKREKILNSYLEEIKAELKPLVRSQLGSGQLTFALCFESKMNRVGFSVKETLLKAS